MSHRISFTEYNRSRSVLHLDGIKHYIISNDKRLDLEKLLSSCDDIAKNELCNIIDQKEGSINSKISLQDYQLRIKLIPARVMNVITLPFLFLFYDYFFLFAFVGCLGYSVYELFFNSHIFLSSTFSIDYSWIFLVVMFIFHEIGHASACKHYGAPIYDVGFGIAAFRPVLYANVTGAWYLNLKKRLVVNIGGIYFQIILSSITTLIAIYSENTSLFYLSKTMLASTVFQFYPFYRTDGYWFISDLMGEPNLYNKSKMIVSKKMSNWSNVVLTKRERGMFIYFITFEGVIIISLLVFVARFFHIIIMLPYKVFSFITQILSGDFHRIMYLSFRDIWVILVFFFIVRFFVAIANKKSGSAKGATEHTK